VVELEVKTVAVFSDSKLIVQQLTGEIQCVDETLNRYHENAWRCWTN
jgi:ribonuclease HI